METDWRKVISDPIEIKVFEALEDPRWEWRTLSALSRVSGLDHEGARRIFRKYPSLIRLSVVPAPNGEELYTLQRRYFDRLSIFDKVITSVSSSSSST